MSPGDEHGYTDTARTRLRLPEDPYTHSPRRNSSRGLVTVVGVVVVLIAAIAFANRGDTPRNTTTDKNTPSGNHPSTSATSPTGTDPVGAKTGGIPTGYAHSRQGAESAGANYATALVSADFLKPARRTEIVKQVFVPSQQASLSQKFDKAYNPKFLSDIGLDANGNPAAGQTYVSRTAPIGTKTTGYADSVATVEVWCTGLYGTAGDRSTSPVTSDWFTLTLRLNWSGGDWKVESFSQEDGPAPVPGDDKASSADQMAKAVQEYGGFTYAR
ncbi:hypothetical protein [Streptomyces sp. NPDC047024]|uniref:hypothetical protein n=1 Tax=Streptomyces sp. NPDC047024 TaxID=3155476 RepID=UPI0033C4B0B8